MKKTVLIVDDNSANLYLLKSLLEEEGLEVIAAENGKDALDKARTNPPDLIVSDVLMPVMDGYTLCRQCRSDEKLKNTPFVFYTATYTEPKDEKFALSLGADRFVLKPQEPETLIRILKEVWEERSVEGAAVSKPLGEEMEFFRRHNEILFGKLEKKMLDLEKANRKLKCLEEQYRLSFENVTDIVWTIDADLKVQKMSPSVEKMLGYKPQDLIGRPVSDLLTIFTPESTERAMTDISLVLQGHTIPAAVYSLIAKDGSVRESEFSGAPILRNGNIVGMVSVIRDITDRKRAEETLISNYALFQIAAETAHFGGWNVDLGNNICTWSDAVADIHEVPRGYAPSVEEGINFYAPEWREKITQVFSACAKEGIPYDEDMVIITRKGKRVWVRTIGKALRNEDGKIIKVQGSFQDITERKRAEEALRESEERYRSVFEDHAAVKLMIDPDNGSIIEGNAAAVNYYGWTYEQLKRMKIQDINTLSPEEVKKEMEKAQTKKQIYFEFRHRRADGSIRDVEVFSSMIDVKGKTLLHSIIHDISERKKAEDDLRKSEARFRSYFELPLIGIAITSPEKGWLEGNDRLSDILGYSWQELKGMTWSELTYPEDLAVDVEQFNRVLTGEIDSYMLDKRFIRKNGEVIWTSLAVGCVRKQDGTVDYFVALFEDITDRKESVERLRKSLGATVQAIAVTVETRDPYTAGHQRRTADLARAIASEMNLSKDQIDGIRLAGIIHDLGKISVPAEILSKPTKLTNIEFSLIKTHSQSGYDILKDIDFPWPIARMVLEHHERMNGSGYPNGLTGDKLLMESRILAVADVVEAMASHRPYRPAIGLDKALDEIAKNKGVLYDTEAVDACLRLFNEKGYKLSG